MSEVRQFIPLPDKPVNQLTAQEMVVFRQWMGLDAGGTSSGGPVVPYPTPEEAERRAWREEWKSRYAGRATAEPKLLVRAEQLEMLRANAQRNEDARRYYDAVLELA